MGIPEGEIGEEGAIFETAHYFAPHVRACVNSHCFLSVLRQGIDEFLGELAVVGVIGGPATVGAGVSFQIDPY